MAKVQGRGAHILIIPYPAQGHMLPLLDLSHLLSTLHNLTITILTTPKNLPLLSPVLSSSPSIQPLILPFPNYPSLPSNIENAKDLPPSGRNFSLLIHALGSLHAPLLSWAQSIANPPDAIISDFLVGWTNKLARQLSIPCITFCPYGALSLSIVRCLWRDLPRLESSADVGFPISFPSVPNSPVYLWSQLSSIYKSYEEGDPVSEFVRECLLANFDNLGFFFDSFEELEGVYLDHVRLELGHARVWAVGPINRIRDSAAGPERGGPSTVPAGDLLTWLDGCGSGSVVYVCFGSQAVLSAAQGAALATGLERSGARFIWCSRAGATEVVPDGFEEKVSGRGLVIKGWAPQVALLSHDSVGSFVTHCGWNSILEGIAGGVVLLTWPMGADQFMNARLVVEEARVGVRVCEGADAVPDPDELARVVAESVSGNSEERTRARELKKRASEAVSEGGSSYKNLDGLVEVLSKTKSTE